MSQAIRKAIKSRLTMTIMIASLLISVLTGAVCIIASSEIIVRQTKEILIITSKNESEKIYRDFKRIETSVNNLSQFEIQVFNLKNSKDREYLLKNQKLLEIVNLGFARITDWNMSSYFYFLPEVTGGVYGSWYVYKPAQNDFTKVEKIAELKEYKRDNPNFVWYYNPLDAKKGVWTDLYLDRDLNIPMITYSEPVSKEGKVIGVAGMDVSLENLKEMVNKIKLYKTTDAFLIDNKYNLIAGQKFKTGENLLLIENGLYKELVNKTKTDNSGIYEYKDKGIKKFATFSKMPNGYTLFITVPLTEALKAISELKIYLITVLIFVWIIADVIALILGNYILRLRQK